MHFASLNILSCAENYVLQKPWSVEGVCEGEHANIRYEVIHYEATQMCGKAVLLTETVHQRKETSILGFLRVPSEQFGNTCTLKHGASSDLVAWRIAITLLCPLAAGEAVAALN
jgi:hypothetical protein